MAARTKSFAGHSKCKACLILREKSPTPWAHRRLSTSTSPTGGRRWIIVRSPATSITAPAATIRSRLSGLPVRAKPLPRPTGKQPTIPSRCLAATSRTGRQSRHRNRRGRDGSGLVVRMACGHEFRPFGTTAPQAGATRASARLKTSMRTKRPNLTFVGALPARRYIILAKASCVDDTANTDVANYACSSMKTQLVDLVSGDNNIGLRVLKS